jgi:hypothetical protein
MIRELRLLSAVDDLETEIFKASMKDHYTRNLVCDSALW